MSSPSTAYTEAWLPGPQNTQFYTRTYPATPPQRAVLVFLHGFVEHIARYAHVFPAWAARGITVFAFDQRGFGRTAEDPVHGSAKKGAAHGYGRTSTAQALGDVEWAVGVAREKAEGAPVFLMGHSMGGALALYFATHSKTALAGVISTSPLILQTEPASKVTRWAGGKLAHLTPNVTIAAPVDEADLSRDKAVGEAYMKDPLVKQFASLRCLSDMLNRGEDLLHSRYKKWPENLPVLFVHGTADKVTSRKATEEFHEKIHTKEKSIKLVEGGYHELQNEPDGVKEQVIEDCIAWVEARLPSKTQAARL